MTGRHVFAIQIWWGLLEPLVGKETATQRAVCEKFDVMFEAGGTHGDGGAGINQGKLGKKRVVSIDNSKDDFRHRLG